jgi:hypothetical protein
VTAWLTRKLAAQCADYACTAPPLPDNCRCEKHRDEHRERNREWWRAKRAQLSLPLVA